MTGVGGAEIFGRRQLGWRSDDGKWRAQRYREKRHSLTLTATLAILAVEIYNNSLVQLLFGKVIFISLFSRTLFADLENKYLKNDSIIFSHYLVVYTFQFPILKLLTPECTRVHNHLKWSIYCFLVVESSAGDLINCRLIISSFLENNCSHISGD